MSGRVDHVGLVVADTGAAVALYASLLGLRASLSHDNESEGVRITFLRAPRGSRRDAAVELIEPIRPDTGVARYLAQRGEGMHHICFEVDDLAGEIARLADAGYQVLDREPRRGAHGERLAFVHPRSARGVLVELYERGSRRD